MYLVELSMPAGSVKDKHVFLPERIVSGGQTGVDRAGLDAAMALNLQHGGWCPKGRRSEDGPIPACYELQEMESPAYPARTEQNIIDSSATVILYLGTLKGGTQLTRHLARRWSRPLVCLDLQTAAPLDLADWLRDQQPQVLNVAGPRESSHPGIGEQAYCFLVDALCGLSG